MKESKISLLLLVSLSMLLLAFVVLFIWAFSYYKQNANSNQPATIIIKDSSAIAGNIRDSLQKIYTSTIHNLNNELDSTRMNADSFQQNMDAKLTEFYTLKNEISAILQNRQASTSDVGLARQKIEELQQRLDEWRNKYADVSEENKRLSRLLKQLSGNMSSTEQPGKKTTVANKVQAEKINDAPAFVVSNIQLKAYMQLDDREQETYEAMQTDQLKGSFELKSTAPSLAGAEMYIVLVQPDGKVMKQSSWESGLFETGEGRKIYSSKVRFDYDKGENKRLNFSIEAEGYQKGNYIMQIYHNGKLIAKATKSLS
jgi:hypothetical protein